MIPFTYKGEWVDKCVKHDNTYICPTSNPHTNWLEKKAYGECASTGCERMPGIKNNRIPLLNQILI